MKLPHGATPLDPTTFAQRYPQYFTEMAAAGRRAIGVIEDDDAARLRLFKATAPGILQVAQFVEMNGEPGIFTQPGLQGEALQYTDALVSYFDRGGQFNPRTGDIVTDAEVSRIEQHVQALIADTDQYIATLGEVRKNLDVVKEGLGQHDKRPAAEAIERAREGLAKAKQVQAEIAALELLLNAPHVTHRRLAAWAEMQQVPTAAVRERWVAAKRVDPDLSIDGWVDQLVADTQAQFTRVLQIAQDLKSYEMSMTSPDGALLGVAFAINELGLDTAQFVEGFATWQQAHPGKDGGDYFDQFVPPDRVADLAARYERFKADIHRYHGALQANSATLDEWIRHEQPRVVEELSQSLTVSKRVVRETLDRWAHTGVLQFVRMQGRGKTGIALIVPDGWPEFASRTERAMRDEINRRFKPRELLRAETPDGVPLSSGQALFVEQGTPLEAKGERPGEHTYMRAIEAQYAALKNVLHVLANARASGQTRVGGLKVDEMLEIDAELLKRADTFCWFEEPILAVEQAAASLPDTVKLTRDLTEHYACWWYFTLPQEIQTTRRDEAVQALLWGWGDDALHFSTYVADEQGDLMPTAQYSWREGQTLAHVLKGIRTKYQQQTAEFRAAMEGALLSEDETMRTVERLLRFFIAGCLWVQQKILVHAKGHIERHERKRMEKLRGPQHPLSDVQIIQLRARESVTPEHNPKLEARDWKCRWVVKGFWRNQYYPSKGHYQPKWIDPFVKGPADKPLKVPTHRVYAVSR